MWRNPRSVLAASDNWGAAIAAADITVMGNDLAQVPQAIELSRKTLGTIKTNLFWAFPDNTIGIPVAAFGLLNPMVAGAAMAARGPSRGLSARHIHFIAFGSAIGTGLFYGSTEAIEKAGPAVLVAYIIVGAAVFVVMRSLGELAVRHPVPGSFGQYASRDLGPLAGFITGRTSLPKWPSWPWRTSPPSASTWGSGFPTHHAGSGYRPSSR